MNSLSKIFDNDTKDKHPNLLQYDEKSPQFIRDKTYMFR